MSSDGRFLSHVLVSSDDEAQEEGGQKIEVRDLATGALLRTIGLPIEHNEVAGFSFSPDGLRAACLRGGRVRMVSLAGDASPLDWDASAVALAWMPEGLATARADGTLDWWRDGERVKSLETGVPRVWRLAPLPGALAVIDAEGRVRCFVAASGEEVLDRIEGDCEEAQDLDDALAIRTAKGTRIYARGRCAATLAEPDPAVRGDFYPWACRSGVLIYHREEKAVLKTLDGSRPDWTLPPHGEVLDRLEWTREGIVALGVDGRVAVLDPGDGKTLRKGGQDEYWISPGRCVQLASIEPEAEAAPDRADLAFAEGSGAVAIRDPHGFRVKSAVGEAPVRLTPEGPSEDMRGLSALSPDGRFLAAVTEGHFITLWNVATQDRIARHALIEDDEVVQISVAGSVPIVLAHLQGPRGSRLRSVNAEGSVVAEFHWSKSEGNPRTLITDRLAVCVERDHDGNGFLAIADYRTPGIPRRIALGEESFDSMGRIHAAASSDRILVEEGLSGVFYASSEEGLLSRTGDFMFRVEQVAGFVEGTHPVVATPQGLRLLYGATGEEIRLDPGIRGTALAVSPDGKRIAVGQGGTVTVYELR